MMKILLFIFLTFLSSEGIGQSVSQLLDQYMQAAQRAGIFNGSVMVTRGNDTLIDKGYGYRDFQAKEGLDAHAIFQIGSVTKQFTSVVILQLAEEGKLSLSDKLSKYFPSFPHAAKISIEQLLTHTSGLYNYTRDTTFMNNEVERPFGYKKLSSMLENKPLDFEPGTSFSYSNSGYLLLGYVIEKVTGKKYEQEVTGRIFRPLHMSHSGFDFTHLQHPAKAVGYDEISDSTAIKSKIVDSSVSFSAGAIYSTTGDMNKWNRAILKKTLLSEPSFINAFTPRLSKYGFGWFIDTLYGKRMIAHNGGINGFLSYNSIIPADSSSITILTNSASSDINKVSRNVLDILCNQPYTLPEPINAIFVDTAVLKHYIGEYELSPNFHIIISLTGGKLKGRGTGQPPFDLFAVTENSFKLKVVDATIEFLKNEQGTVDTLILHQNGQKVPGKKL